jgi:hypothetical protein
MPIESAMRVPQLSCDDRILDARPADSGRLRRALVGAKAQLIGSDGLNLAMQARRPA